MIEAAHCETVVDNNARIVHWVVPVKQPRYAMFRREHGASKKATLAINCAVIKPRIRPILRSDWLSKVLQDTTLYDSEAGLRRACELWL